MVTGKICIGFALGASMRGYDVVGFDDENGLAAADDDKPVIA